MKITLFILVAFSILCTGCGNTDDAGVKAISTTTETQDSGPETFRGMLSQVKKDANDQILIPSTLFTLTLNRPDEGSLQIDVIYHEAPDSTPDRDLVLSLQAGQGSTHLYMLTAADGTVHKVSEVDGQFGYSQTYKHPTDGSDLVAEAHFYQAPDVVPTCRTGTPQNGDINNIFYGQEGARDPSAEEFACNLSRSGCWYWLYSPLPSC